MENPVFNTHSQVMEGSLRRCLNEEFIEMDQLLNSPSNDDMSTRIRSWLHDFKTELSKQENIVQNVCEEFIQQLHDIFPPLNSEPRSLLLPSTCDVVRYLFVWLRKHGVPLSEDIVRQYLRSGSRESRQRLVAERNLKIQEEERAKDEALEQSTRRIIQNAYEPVLATMSEEVADISQEFLEMSAQNRERIDEMEQSMENNELAADGLEENGNNIQERQKIVSQALVEINKATQETRKKLNETEKAIKKKNKNQFKSFASTLGNIVIGVLSAYTTGVAVVPSRHGGEVRTSSNNRDNNEDDRKDSKRSRK